MRGGCCQFAILEGTLSRGGRGREGGHIHIHFDLFEGRVFLLGLGGVERGKRAPLGRGGAGRGVIPKGPQWVSTPHSWGDRKGGAGWMCV